MKQVIYNGGTQSYYGCSDPIALRKGAIYNVVHEDDRGWQTDYTLESIEGEFNSTWFDSILPTYFAIGNNIPVEGKSYVCKKVVVESDTTYLKGWRTSTVQNVECVGMNTYKLTTMNSIYIVNIQ